MKQQRSRARSIFREIGRVHWTRFDAFAVKTKRGATFLLSPNSEDTVPTQVHLDELTVPELLRRQGAATEALAALCRLADKYGFELKGGPVGWSDDPWSNKFVAWLRRFGFEEDSTSDLPPVDDPTAFYTRRSPRPRGPLDTAPSTL